MHALQLTGTLTSTQTFNGHLPSLGIYGTWEIGWLAVFFYFDDFSHIAQEEKTVLIVQNRFKNGGSVEK